jgi:hypothetical protein
MMRLMRKLRGQRRTCSSLTNILPSSEPNECSRNARREISHIGGRDSSLTFSFLGECLKGDHRENLQTLRLWRFRNRCHNTCHGGFLFADVGRKGTRAPRVPGCPAWGLSEGSCATADRTGPAKRRAGAAEEVAQFTGRRQVQYVKGRSPLGSRLTTSS